MHYMSNRNYGCRFKEITLNGCRSLLMENELVSALVLLDKGSDIAEFVYKKTDTDFFWRSPNGLDLLGQPNCGREPYVGGWFEAFPNAGEPCVYNKTPIERFGDIRFLAWEYSVIEDTPEVLSIKTFVRTNTLPLTLEKTMTLRTGDAHLYFDEKVTNLSFLPMDFTWGHHPNISRPFLDENCEVEMESGTFHLLNTDKNGVTTPEEIGVWPYFTIDGKTIDARRIPPFSSKEPELSMLYLNNIGSSLKIRNRKSGLSFTMNWDEKTFKGMLMCRAFLGQEWNSTFGYRYILVPFILSSYHACLTDALRYNDAIHLEPGQCAVSSFRFGAEEE
jgi:hypothetical protein